MRVTMPEGSPWLATGDQKREAVRRMFAEIAPSYDLLNSLMSVRAHHRWRSVAVKTLGLKSGNSALDICCGTGDFMLPLRKTVGSMGKVVGVDFCEPMLKIAGRKLKSGDGLYLADASSLPFSGETFDGVAVGWGLRNVPDLQQALNEAFRVLRPGGRFACLDMARPRNRIVGPIAEWVFHTFIPLVGRLFGSKEAYTYLPKSAAAFSSREDLKSAMERSGFCDVTWRDLYFGNVCLHMGRRP